MVAELYDHVPAYRERKDVAFYVEEARRAEGPVLELGCGTGRILVPTARAGVEICGLDASPSMLAACRRKLEAEPHEVQARCKLFEGDVRGFDLGRTFHLVTCPFRVFQHLETVDDQLACLEAVRAHLAPGGRFVLDVFNPWVERIYGETGRSTFEEEPPFVLPDGRRVVRRTGRLGVNAAAQLVEVEIDYEITHRDGRRESLVHAFPMRYVFRYEAEHLLERAGLRVQDVWCDFQRAPFGAQYPGELILAARRPA
jgi:SAM-dependent methyltransferase